MRAGAAREAAAAWVHDHAATAYYTGSTVGLPDSRADALMSGG